MYLAYAFSFAHMQVYSYGGGIILQDPGLAERIIRYSSANAACTSREYSDGMIFLHELLFCSYIGIFLWW